VSPISCFLVDNDIEDQEIFILALREIDPLITCMVADGAMSAIDKFSSDRSIIPKFIFIDMNMPLMNGIECLQELRKLEHLKEIPIYMYSAAEDKRVLSQVKILGATDFIIKPSSFRGLVDLLEKLLQRNS
jgi:CheY-like chemotaxis protein